MAWEIGIGIGRHRSIIKTEADMVELMVEGMTCGGCAASVTRALQRLDGTARVDVRLEEKLVRVESNADIEQIRAAIGDAGFDVMQAKSL